MRALLIISILSSLFTSFVSSANDMRIYGFTSDFIACVKSHADESYNEMVPGNADSSLMNGAAQLGGGPLGSNYWSYMNCLSRTNSGTVNESLGASSGCGELKITLGSKEFYLPPGLKDKRVGVAGRFFKCSSGKWSQADAPYGGNEQEEDDNDSCREKTKVIESCRFTFPDANHGVGKSDAFGPIFGDDAEFEGSARASCDDGDWEVSSYTCQPTGCQSGEVVHWQGYSQTHGLSPTCSSEISEGGYAIQEERDLMYFASEETARSHTRILNGQSAFVCTRGSWVQDRGAGDSNYCEQKAPSELRCYSTLGPNGAKKYFCE